MYIDAHNHLDYYKDHVAEAIKRIEKEKILTLACAVDVDSYFETKRLASGSELIVPCFGIHPSKAWLFEDKLDTLDYLIKETPVIGEVGLDFHWVKVSDKFNAQRKVFDYFLEKAEDYGKVMNIHTKGAEEEVLERILAYDLVPPIIHWYSGPLDVFWDLLDYGCYFTISVDAGFREETDDLIDLLPMDRILTETDGPDAMEWVMGAYGYPDAVKDVVANIADIKGVSEEEMKEIIFNNFTKLFGEI